MFSVHYDRLTQDTQAEMAGSGNVSWERFEEQTKLAFVGDPLRSRFFLKTRVTANKSVKVVARVAHQSAKPQGREEAVKYATADASNLSRLTRLLRFVMQEVLGAMKALPASTASQPKPVDAPAAADPASKKKKKTAKK
ncbi:hypothetical protein PF005_g13773 [Phytophthora fragariae]|uniref:Uncharacterized protein n=2 Tax=Phytophthora fragariae TaxID=53985 RepID=A0A6A4DA18_9STRA|nr:hypothetical protein PF005_g13773 [Phytophthora fragariae]KAE9304172.1 hypothetical protein PF001_g13208 [Phytophthora fragariae]KAE9338264.1 hypothetical protein PF008_g12149 [Phytophthora fragariae]